MSSHSYQRLGQLGNTKALLTLWVGLSSLPACGGIPVLNGDASTFGGTSGASGGASSAGGGTPVLNGDASTFGGTSGASGGASSTGGGPSNCDTGPGALLGGKVCVSEQPTDGPALISGAQSITATAVDPNSVCKATTCAVEKALDLVYSRTVEFNKPMIAVNPESVWVVSPDWKALLTVTPSGVSAQDLKGWVGAALRLTVDATGALWLVDGASCTLNALRVTDHGYASVAIPTGVIHDFYGAGNPYVGVLAADMVDANTGYVGFIMHSAEWSIYEYHVASWDGSCWTDHTLSAPVGLIVTDVNQRPWVAGYSCDPDSYTESGEQCTINVNSLDTAMPDEQFSYVGFAGYFLPGGPQGALLSFATRNSAGVHVISFDPSGTSHWVEHVLPFSKGTTVSDCPTLVESLCQGQTHCQKVINGMAGTYQVLQTPTGAVFAAWLEYTGHAEFDLQDGGGCTPCSTAASASAGADICCHYSCQKTETSSTGTVDLVIDRLADPNQSDAGQGDSTQSQARFRIYEGTDTSGGLFTSDDSLAIAARGDMLAVVVSTRLRGLNAMRYLELDSTRLP